MSIGSYVIATEPLGEQRARELIANNAAVCDTNWILDYFRRSSDHRLLFGGRVNYSLLNVRAVGAGHARHACCRCSRSCATRASTTPGAACSTSRSIAHRISAAWSPNVYFLQGFSGHGIALAGIAGQLVAEAIAGTAERFDVFARIPHRDFPGGMLLRRPALALAMLWYRLRDLL